MGLLETLLGAPRASSQARDIGLLGGGMLGGLLVANHERQAAPSQAFPMPTAFAPDGTFDKARAVQEIGFTLEQADQLERLIAAHAARQAVTKALQGQPNQQARPLGQ